ncbi:MAG: aminotransferase class I/II-fold pyridoxal phosphate-dependent enzyme [Vulcanococcus sp.]|uniref:pyridoxal phosphate-dependent aminotransferase n=1 Tax=Vulcanococcus sp. TaxID=2856995 RepID=UPI0025CE4BB3|nr:aminotransferase class I/II-fold pyridoxal phosphate-dependent enzyme [Vulcanococcus sp.]MBW0167531.1 aminotransferase class I/II-fold pyridoxal phosphate-dependent enzyme [Vulcanococcus sp.]
MLEAHGGNLAAAANRLGCRPSQILDASASLVPFALPWQARLSALTAALHPYPDRGHAALRQCLASLHGLVPGAVLPGNGAAELFTWAARDAAAEGLSLLPQPGFADYTRSLACWGGAVEGMPLPLQWSSSGPTPFPEPVSRATVLWITNPHNPTGQLWSRVSLEPLVRRFALVICDEAFLPLVPKGEDQSLIPLVSQLPNLVVIRSLTKLYGIAGLRLGYAVAQPERLQRWAQWRDPWPVNAVSSAVGQALLRSPSRHHHWMQRVQRWTVQEGSWLQEQLADLPCIIPMLSAANYLLIRGEERAGEPWSLQPLRQALESRHRILLRDCRSFEGLDDSWLRIGFQTRRGNRRIIQAMRKELYEQRSGIPA